MQFLEEIKDKEQQLRAEIVEYLQKKIPDLESNKGLQIDKMKDIPLYFNTSYQLFQVANKLRYFTSGEGRIAAEDFSNGIYRIVGMNEDPLNQERPLGELFDVKFLQEMNIQEPRYSKVFIRYQNDHCFYLWADSLAGVRTSEMHIQDMALLLEILTILDTENLLDEE